MVRLLLCLLASALLGPFGGQTTIRVTVQNIQVGQGSIAVAVYGSSGDFLKKPLAAQRRPAGQSNMDFTFDLPPGQYAIAAYQDLNDNGQLDAGMFNIPKEPYGFSNNYRPRFSAPHYEDCAIRVDSPMVCIIHLK